MADISLTFDTPDLARHYEEASAERQYRAGQALVALMAIAPGEKVLDIGAGTGLLAAYVADRVGPAGAVVGIDPLALRIGIAKAKARANLSFAVGNAYDLGAFPAEGFDVVYLNAVFHWLTDKRKALGQIARVLKPGGRLGIATGSKSRPNPIQAIKAEVLARAPYNLYPRHAAGVAQRIDPDEMARLLDEAGFDARAIELRPSVIHHASAEAAIRFSEASSFGNFLGHLPEPLRAAARSDIETALEALRTPDGIRQESARIFAVAVKRCI